ncbi:MAG: hypothetical protein Q7R39_02835, partial [Dehalococcoidia bacterium]|nr:hypothetical protein [Dehalococcoidia bacterium]
REPTQLETRGNRLAPCRIIDHPRILREAVQNHGARPSHEGSESFFTSLSPILEKCGQDYLTLTQPIFEKEYLPWYNLFQGKVPTPEVTKGTVKETSRA